MSKKIRVFYKDCEIEQIVSANTSDEALVKMFAGCKKIETVKSFSTLSHGAASSMP